MQEAMRVREGPFWVLLLAVSAQPAGTPQTLEALSG